MGNIPAQATANKVMASENRLIDVRQSCFKRKRTADISVPAWPIPIHQTKLMMAKPQAIGILIPQMPTPFRNNTQTHSASRLTKQKATNAPTIHFLGDFLN